jgi:hypothetical protein
VPAAASPSRCRRHSVSRFFKLATGRYPGRRWEVADVLRLVVEKPLAVLGAALFLFSIAGVVISFTEVPAAQNLAAAQIDGDAAPTATEPHATPTPVLWLPGLSAYDVTVNLEKQRFDCTSPDLSQPTVTWECTRAEQDRLAEYVVSITGSDSSHVSSVDAQVVTRGTTPNGEIAAAFISSDFLSSMAALPYEGADMSQARAWVKQNVADGGETTIGSAQFSLASEGQSWNLNVSALDAQ